MNGVKRDQRGFTLVETMVVCATSAIICYAILLAMQIGNDHMDAVQIRMSLQDSAREGLYRMIQEIRQSSPSRITIGGVGGNSITFRVPDPASAVDGTYNLDWGSSHQINYSIGGMNNRQVIRTDLNTGRQAVLVNDVTGLNFSAAAGNSVITITISVQRTLTRGRLMPATPLQITGQAEVRNA